MAPFFELSQNFRQGFTGNGARNFLFFELPSNAGKKQNSKRKPAGSGSAHRRRKGSAGAKDWGNRDPESRPDDCPESRRESKWLQKERNFPMDRPGGRRAPENARTRSPKSRFPEPRQWGMVPAGNPGGKRPNRSRAILVDKVPEIIIQEKLFRIGLIPSAPGHAERFQDFRLSGRFKGRQSGFFRRFRPFHGESSESANVFVLVPSATFPVRRSGGPVLPLPAATGCLLGLGRVSANGNRFSHPSHPCCSWFRHIVQRELTYGPPYRAAAPGVRPNVHFGPEHPGAISNHP